MGRNLLSSMAVAAAAALLAACGGQSSAGPSTTSAASTTGATTTTTTSASRPSTKASGGQTVSAVHGGFNAVIPKRYRNGLTVAATGVAGAEYVAVGPPDGKYGTSVSVFRIAAGGRDVATVANTALRNLAHQPSFLPRPRHISTLQSLSIDGEPALAVDYQLAGRKTSYRRQLFVVHGSWAYEISDAAASPRYTASLDALDEVIHSWRWQ
jgi:hypothetical protein